jgi:hypothetical protein
MSLWFKDLKKKGRKEKTKERKKLFRNSARVYVIILNSTFSYLRNKWALELASLIASFRYFLIKFKRWGNLRLCFIINFTIYILFLSCWHYSVPQILFSENLLHYIKSITTPIIFDSVTCDLLFYIFCSFPLRFSLRALVIKTHYYLSQS